MNASLPKLDDLDRAILKTLMLTPERPTQKWQSSSMSACHYPCAYREDEVGGHHRRNGGDHQY